MVQWIGLGFVLCGPVTPNGAFGSMARPQELEDLHIDHDDQTFDERVEEALAQALAHDTPINLARKPRGDHYAATTESNTALDNAVWTFLPDCLNSFLDMGRGPLSQVSTLRSKETSL